LYLYRMSNRINFNYYRPESFVLSSHTWYSSANAWTSTAGARRSFTAWRPFTVAWERKH
jgi:hypothetical protein